MYYYYYYYGNENDSSLKLQLKISTNSSAPILWKDLNEYTSIILELHRHIILMTQEQYETGSDLRDLDQEIFLWHELSIENIKRENPVVFDLIISHLTDPKIYLLLLRYLFHGCVKYNKQSSELKSNIIKFQSDIEGFMSKLGIDQEKINSGGMYQSIRNKVRYLFQNQNFVTLYNRFCRYSFEIKEFTSDSMNLIKNSEG